VRVTWDGETAWLGAFCTQPGIAVFAGTGSGALGCDGERRARAGGHGFLLGDEGSAYWIGRAAANAALRWEDGTGGSAALRDAVVEACGSDLDALVEDVNSHPAERGRLALLAPVATALAGEDETARRIALEAAGHLAELASAVRRRLGPLPVCGMGGVLRAPVIWDRFAELTGAVRPLAPPEVGAALLAGRGRAC
jgi:N-acetylglucosamine kinase-like BadF-type ATPase